MTKINLITMIDKKYKKSLDYKKFDKIKTFGELDKLIFKTLKSRWGSCSQNNTICINNQLIVEGHAYVYEGGKKKLLTEVKNG